MSSSELRPSDSPRRRSPPGRVVLLRFLSTVALGCLLPGGGASAQLPGALRVEVRVAGEGRPLPDAFVELVGTPWTARTDPSGRVLLRGVPEGRYRLRARHPGFAPADAEVEVRNGETVPVELHLLPAPFAVAGVTVSVDRLPDGARVVEASEAGPGVRDVADLVEEVSGVRVVRRGGAGTPLVPTIRGSRGDEVLVLVDGVVLNSPLTGEADLSRVDLATLRRAVVVPGVRAARYGPGALAGAILLETRSGDEGRRSGSVEGGSLGELAVRGEGGTRLPVGEGWTLGGGASWERSEGDFEYSRPLVRGGGEAVRENAEHRSYAGWLQADRAGGDGPRLRLRLHARDARRGSPGTIVQPSTTGEHHQRRIGGVLRLEEAGGAGGWSASVAADAHRARFRDPDPPFGPAFDADARVHQLDARTEGWWRGEAWTVRGGVDGRIRRVRASSLSGDDPRVLVEGGLWLRAERSLPVGEGGWLRGVAGARIDGHELVGGPVVSPSFSLVGGSGPTRGELSLGSSFSPPGLTDLFFEEGVLARANPDLAPERIPFEVELGISHAIGGPRRGGEVAVTAFKGAIDGMILWFPDHRFVWSPRNVDVRREGVEWNGTLHWGRLRRLRGRLTWTRVDLDEGALGGQAPHRPRLHADLDATLAWGALEIDGSWRWVGRRRTRLGSDANALDPYHVLSLAVATRLPTGIGALDLDLGVDDLLDGAGSLLVDYPLPGRSWFLRARLTSNTRRP